MALLGAKKLLIKLRQESPRAAWPSPSTSSEILRREGLSQPRRRRRRPLTVEQPFGAVTAANDAWCIDFKGWFRTGDGRRCDPLTVTDAFSRYILAVEVIEPVTKAVQAKMDELFKTHGVPAAIRSDNGPPFASSGAGGLTTLSARWARMGIRLERIWPGKPQQNGRHERMHGTLKPEACQPPSATVVRQQNRFDVFPGSSTMSGRTRLSASAGRPSSIALRPGLSSNLSVTSTMARTSRSGAYVPTARSSGMAPCSSCPMHSTARPLASANDLMATGSSASPTYPWASSIEARENSLVLVRGGRAGPKRALKPSPILSGMYLDQCVRDLSGCAEGGGGLGVRHTGGFCVGRPESPSGPAGHLPLRGREFL